MGDDKMKINKFILFGLVLIFSVQCFATMPILSENTEGNFVVLQSKGIKSEFLKNGDLEISSGQFAENWKANSGAIGKEFFYDDEISRSGHSIRVTSPDASFSISQQISGMVSGGEYEISAWVYPNTLEGSIAIKVEMYSLGSDGTQTYLDPAQISFRSNDLKIKEWNRISLEFNAAKNAYIANCMFRLFNGGDIYFDDLSLIGEEGEATSSLGVNEIKNDAYVPMPEWSRELLTNTDFETLDKNGHPEGWRAFAGNWGKDEFVTLSDSMAHSGKHSVKIETDEGNQPWVMQKFKLNEGDMVPGARYIIGYWINIESSFGSGAGFKLEWYNEGTYLAGVSPEKLLVATTNGNWMQYVQFFVAPDLECDEFAFYMRLYGRGKIHVDDPFMYMIEKPPMVHLDTNEIFYYTDATKATAKAEANLPIYPDLADSGVDFRILDDGVTVAEKLNVPLNDGVAEYVFNPALHMTKEKKEYIIEARLKDKNDNVLETKSHKISRYPRPSKIRDDGVYLKDGEPFYPVIMYHVYDDYEKVKEIGVNTVQGGTGQVGRIKERLDLAHSHGLMVMVPLYYGMRPAGHPNNAELTTEVVTTLKDHPALLCWMVMDEPTAHYPDQYNLWYDSYKLIRDIDDDNPVYMIQAAQKYVYEIGKYVDILANDPYTIFNRRKADFVSDFTIASVEAVEYNKPVWEILQIFAARSTGIMPDITHYRNTWYRALFAGANAVGGYAFSDAKYIDDEATPLFKLDIWEDLLEFTEEEQGESYNHFLKNMYPVFSNFHREDVWVSSYIKEGSLHMIVLNNSDEPVSAEIPLVSDGGTVSIGEYTAKGLYGTKEVLSGNGILNVSLVGDGVHVYKITSSSPVDFSSLNPSKYKDLYTHPWAAEQIRSLRSKDIINDITPISYAPGRNITRGDFAYFLIRTLGLTSDSADNFDDVDPKAHYAKEIATGKALGILQGIGDNKYNPEKEISRQDLMVICARGMDIVKDFKDEDTSSVEFFDSAEIADYAISDIAAMVRANIIKGNADGTINPIGNATRAESAVIMSRILDWKRGH